MGGNGASADWNVKSVENRQNPVQIIFLALPNVDSSLAPRCLPVPVGERHHDVERCQEEHEVEEGVAVLDHVALIVLQPPGSCGLLREVGAAAALGQDGRVFGGHGQLVHLAGAGRTNAEEEQRHERIPCVSKRTFLQWHLTVTVLMITVSLLLS